VQSELNIAGTTATIQPPLNTQIFNGGLVDLWGRLLTVYRINRRPTLLGVSELNDELRPIDTRILWDAWDASFMPEDPRVIAWRDSLYIQWAGIGGQSCERSQICHGAWGSDYKPLWKAPCWFPKMDSCEKNWTPFLAGGELFAIYDWQPFIVLRYRSGAWGLEFAKRLDFSAWDYGRLRGGAPPVFHNGRWYCFFHSSRIRGQTKIYYAGCAVFDPDWRLVAVTSEPILAGLPDVYVRPEELPWRPGSNVAAVFPCGALVRGREWLLSYGYLDAELKIARISVDAIDYRLGLL
jgi:predicted GH43/DUF377 family glycosyl hydrolase